MSIPGYGGIGTYAGYEGPEGHYVSAEDLQKITGHHTLGFGGGYTQTFLRTGHTAGEEDFNSTQTSFGADTGDALASFLIGVPNNADRQGGEAWGRVYELAVHFSVELLELVCTRHVPSN